MYAEIDFTNPQNFMALFAGVVNCLKDPDLPVKVDAIVSLGSFVETADDISQIRPILPQLLDEFFALMNEVESEEMVFTLETIVEKFGEEIAPYAMGMTQNLVAAFWKLNGSQDQTDEDDFTGACFRGVPTRDSHHPGIPLRATPHVRAARAGADAHHEEDARRRRIRRVRGGFGVLSYMTYYAPAVSPAMWELWPVLISALDGEYGAQYFENTLVPMDNYTRAAPKRSWRTPPAKATAQGRIRRAPEQRHPRAEMLPAPKLLECPPELQGSGDDCVAPYFRRAGGLKTCELTYLRTFSSRSWPTACGTTALTLDILVKNGALGARPGSACLEIEPKRWKQGKDQREHDKKVCIRLVALIQTPAQSLPAGLPRVWARFARLS